MGNSSPPRPVSRPCDPISEAQRRAHLAQHTATARLYLRASSEFSEKHFDSFELSDDEEANTALGYQRQHEAQPSPGPSSSSSPSPLTASSSPATSSSSSSSSSSPAAFNRGKNPQIVILSQEQVASIQSNALKQMQAILGPELSLANVALLLQHFSWVSETLIEAYVADPEGTCRQAGVMVAPFDAAKDEEIMDHNRTELSKLHHVSVSSSDASTPAFSTFDPRAVALQLLPEVDSAPQLHLHDDDDNDDDDDENDDDENDEENDDLNSISSASSSLNSGLHDPSSSRLPEQVLQAILSDQRHSQDLKYEQDLELLKIAHGELVDFTFARSLMEGDDAETQQLMDAQHASLVSSLISLLNSIPIHLRPPNIQLPSGVTPESTSTSSTTTTVNAAAAAAAAIHEEEGSPSIDGLGFSTGDPAYQLVKSHYDAVMSPFWEERQRAILEESVALDTRRQKRAHRIRKRGVRAAVLPRSLREGSGASLAAEEGSLELSAKRGTPGRQYLLTSAEFPLRELAEEADTPVLATDMSSSLLSAMQGADPEEALTCSVCFADYLRKEGHSLACNHWFCTDCWSLFWESQLSDADNATFAKCMDRSCHLLVDKVRARQWLSAPQFARYERFFVHSFVQKNPSTVWCSSPSSCNNIALFTGPGAPPLNFVVLCTCGWHFCWHCKEAQHRPATCDQNQLWKQQMAKEGGAPTWVLQHTKACPGCSSPIEKNEGCLHMTCKCRHEFCWMVRFPFFPPPFLPFIDLLICLFSCF